MNRKLILAAVLGALAIPAAASAHFILHAPANMLEQTPLGDPQKLAPCGGVTGNPGVPTNAVTDVKGGEPLHIKIQETVFHPGHYRVSLAVKDRSELPADPETVTKDSERGPRSVSTKIATDIKPPLLADGLFPHTEAPAKGSFWETDVKLPNINCKGCTLQIVQWMGEHGHNPDGDFSYHHCSVLNITANPKLPIDKRWPGQG